MKLGQWSAENYDLLVIEDIHVEQLVGRAYRKLRTRLRDVSFHGLKSLLKYQVEKYGRRVILVDPAFTPKACAECGHVKGELTLQDLVFSRQCGSVADRDYNASLNVLRRSGLERLSLWSPLPLGRGGAVKREAPSVRRG